VVATACFGGQVSSIYAGSIFHLQRAVRSLPNLDLTVLMRDGDALITRARANLVTLFLDDPSATHLLFVDADIGFVPDQVFRLIESGADVVAGVYPIKRVNWEKAHCRTVLRRHVSDRRTIRNRQRRCARAIKFNEFADYFLSTQHLRDMQNEIGRGDAFAQLAGHVHTDHFRR